MRCGDAWRFGEDWEVVKLRGGGAGLSDEQREEMTNREGVARAAQQLIIRYILTIIKNNRQAINWECSSTG